MNNGGKDANGGFPGFNPNYNQQSPNGSYNANLSNSFPFQMPNFFAPQPPYHQQGVQNYDDVMMDNYNTPNAQQLMQHNQFAYNMAGGANMNLQPYSPSQPGFIAQPDTTAPSSQQQAAPQRAAELRLRLIDSMKKKNSATPPNSALSSPNMPSTVKQSQASKPQGAPSEHLSHAQPGDRDVDDLLNEAKRNAADGNDKQHQVQIKKEKVNADNTRLSLQTPIKKAGAPNTNGSQAIPIEQSSPILNKFTRRAGDRTSQATSDMSDGEIVDDAKPRRPLPPTGPKESELSVVKRKQAEDQAARDRREDQPAKQPEKTENASPKLHRSPSMVSSRPPVSRPREERNDNAESRTSNRRQYQEVERQPRVEQKRYERREEHGGNSRDNGGSMNNNSIRARPDEKKPEPAKVVPLLEQVLAEDEDLRLWLNMTNYHDIEDREAKLKKYREWLAISQRAAELEAEVGGIFRAPTKVTPAPAAAAMPPPPAPTKVNEENNMSSRSTSIRRSENASATSTNTTELLGKRGRDNDDVGKESSDKYARIDSEGRGLKIKGEGSGEYHRPDAPRSSFGESDGNSRYKHEDNGRRRSLSPRPNRPDSKDSGRGEYVGRGRGRGYNHNQDHDGFRAYENRPPARNMSRDRDFQGGIDNDDWKSRRLNESSEPEHGGEYRGVSRGYRGKNWVPHFNENRGRGGFYGGRGRGRGSDPSDASPRTYGNGSAMKPKGYKETWDKGGKGDTRFFILKSFNEENIIHCQKDSVWTTQEHNAEMLVEAFKSCKNVIFCFSINSSKHFQGYARMESLPGSEKSPIWQNKIRFPTAGAFRVKWLTVANTHFGRVGHLKNSLNEGSKVYVGKDGQEIEEEAGRELVTIIDEEFEHRYQAPFEDRDENNGGSVMVKNERGGGNYMGRGGARWGGEMGGGIGLIGSLGGMLVRLGLVSCVGGGGGS